MKLSLMMSVKKEKKRKEKERKKITSAECDARVLGYFYVTRCRTLWHVS